MQAGSVKWESLAELCEDQGGSVVGQEVTAHVVWEVADEWERSEAMQEM